MNQALWSDWTAGDDTSNVFYADYNTTGSGVTNLKRISFSTVLTQSQANAYSVSSAVGTDYATWVDPNYLE
jgi:pectinesterase